MTPHHTDRAYEAELRRLKERLLLMAGRVQAMLAQATRAVFEHDAALARRTIEDDRQVNRDELEIDELGLQLLARRQPMASDLRFIAFALKMVTDLERLGDLAVDICQRALKLASGPRLGVHPALRQMAELSSEMVAGAIDAFLSGDADAAHRVAARDDRVDALYHDFMREMLARMRESEGDIGRWLHLQYVARFLERVADHATNLSEQVIFMVGGQDIRHPGSRSPG